ncbi:MAG TPA: hypothetical protein VK596_02560 [Edaphobacter sp.]|nr:hypothetical protein [Edaphobacter sp.]
MRAASAMLLASVFLAPLLPAQNPSPQNNNVYVLRDGGTSGRMESITVPPIVGAPFSLTLITEWSRSLAGSGTVTLTNQRPIMRDGRGRIYQERWFLVPKGGSIKSQLEIIQIMDPVQHTWYNCAVRSKICELLNFNMRTDMVYKPSIGVSGPLPDGKGYRQHEELGTSNTSGEDVTGYRDILTLNPGVMGNDQPLVSTRESWYSPHLGINLISKVDTPTTGKQVFTIDRLTTSEPDPKFFEIPEGYKIVDHRRPEGSGSN